MQPLGMATAASLALREAELQRQQGQEAELQRQHGALCTPEQHQSSREGLAGAPPPGGDDGAPHCQVLGSRRLGKSV